MGRIGRLHRSWPYETPGGNGGIGNGTPVSGPTAEGTGSRGQLSGGGRWTGDRRREAVASHDTKEGVEIRRATRRGRHNLGDLLEVARPENTRCGDRQERCIGGAGVVEAVDLSPSDKSRVTGGEFVGDAADDEGEDAFEHIHSFLEAVMTVGRGYEGAGWDPDLEDGCRATGIDLVEKERHRECVQPDRGLGGCAHGVVTSSVCKEASG